MLAYGESLVWERGLAALGYPPTWAHQVHEANKVHLSIKSHLESNPDLLGQIQDTPVGKELGN